MSLDIILKRHNSTYFPNEKINGYVKVNNKKAITHMGIQMRVEGKALLHLTGKALSLFDAISSSTKRITLFSCNLYLSDAGKLPPEVEIPFEFDLIETEGRALLDSYRGVFVNIQYIISCEVLKGKLSKPLYGETEFFVRTVRRTYREKTPYSSSLTNSMLKVSKKETIPAFKVDFKLESTVIAINEFMGGVIEIEECESKIRSIELKLMRRETIRTSKGEVLEESEIQNIQVVDGEPVIGLPIPFNIVFPNLYSCSSLATEEFVLDFKLLLMIKFEKHKEFTMPVPVSVYRVEEH